MHFLWKNVSYIFKHKHFKWKKSIRDEHTFPLFIVKKLVGVAPFKADPQQTSSVTLSEEQKKTMPSFCSKKEEEWKS